MQMANTHHRHAAHRARTVDQLAQADLALEEAHLTQESAHANLYKLSCDFQLVTNSILVYNVIIVLHCCILIATAVNHRNCSK